MSIHEVSSVQNSAMVTGVTNNAAALDSNGLKNIDMTVQKSPEYIKTENVIKEARRNYEELVAMYNNSSTNDIIKKALKSKIDALKFVYNNTNYEILNDGSVKFKFKDKVNVEIFKEAYGIKTGGLREYLSNRHNEHVQIGLAEISKVKYREYDDSEFEIYTTKDKTPQELKKMYNNGGLGSELIYSDGFKYYITRGTFQPNLTAPDYTQMSLSESDRNFMLDKTAFRSN